MMNSEFHVGYSVWRCVSVQFAFCAAAGCDGLLVDETTDCPAGVIATDTNALQVFDVLMTGGKSRALTTVSCTYAREVPSASSSTPDREPVLNFRRASCNLEMASRSRAMIVVPFRKRPVRGFGDDDDDDDDEQEEEEEEEEEEDGFRSATSPLV